MSRKKPKEVIRSQISLVMWLLFLLAFILPWLSILCFKKKNGKKKDKNTKKDEKTKDEVGSKVDKQEDKKETNEEKKETEEEKKETEEEKKETEEEKKEREENQRKKFWKPMKERYFEDQAEYIREVKEGFTFWIDDFMKTPAELEEETVGDDDLCNPLEQYLICLDFDEIRPAYLDHFDKNCANKEKKEGTYCKMCNHYMHWAAFHYVLNAKKVLSIECPERIMSAWEEDFYERKGNFGEPKLPCGVEAVTRYVEYQKKRDPGEDAKSKKEESKQEEEKEEPPVK